MTHTVDKACSVARLFMNDLGEIVRHLALVCWVADGFFEVGYHIVNLNIRAAVLRPLERAYTCGDCGIGIRSR